MVRSLARKRFAARSKRVLRHMTPRHMIRSRMAAKTIRHFADTMGMVYFGSVHHDDQDHRLVRGHTVSHTHRDNHYAVGSIRGYDVSLVLRNDVMLIGREQKERRCHWLILTVDLLTKTDVPHLYVGHRSRDEAFKASFERLSALYLGALAPYPHRFLSEYTLYGQAARLIEIEQMVTPQIAEVVVTHFDGASFEIEQGTIYLYVENQRPTEGELNTLLSNGLWLAELIDGSQDKKE